MYPETITNNLEASAAVTVLRWILMLEAQEHTAMSWQELVYTCVRMQLATENLPWLLMD
jgi:hypothetical protein